MALQYGFFDSEIIGYDDEEMPIFDRAESSDILALFISKIISDGVLALPGDCFQVVAHDGMTLKVRPGFGIIRGRFAYDTQDFTVTLTDAPTSYKRIDRVILRANYLQRLCEIIVRTGYPDANPVPPELLQPASGDYYELCLATVAVNSNQTVITQANITDTRYDSSVCGIVTQVIDHLDTSVFYAQMNQLYTELVQKCDEISEEFKLNSEYKFSEWFEKMKNQLSTDAAGNLQNQIDVERERINNLARIEEGSTSGDAELTDIRIGANGKTYKTAGEAVRTQFLNMNNTFDNITKKSEFYPVTLADVTLNQAIRNLLGVDPETMIGDTISNVLDFVVKDDHCVYVCDVKKGDSFVKSNTWIVMSDFAYFFVTNTDDTIVDAVYFDDVEEKYTFAENGRFYISFMYGNVQVGEFFYIKRVGEKVPLVLEEVYAETYLTDSALGDETLNAILNGRQILVRIPNADGGNYTANYSPVYMYQLPNYDNNYLYLFYLKDEKETIDLSENGAGKVEMPVYGQLKMLLSKTYNADPLR